MKKYLSIYKMTFLESIQYISNILFGFIAYIVTIYIFLCLWKYLYQDPSSLIEGYSITQMIWYVLVTECMWYGNRNRTLTEQICNDIKSGSIAYNLNKPYNYLSFIVFKHFGDITFKFICYAVMSVILGLIFVGPIDGFFIQNIPFIIISVVLGSIINSLIRITISLFSFWVEDTTPFQWIYDKIILVIGTLFPVELFPKILQPIMKCTPIFVVNYGPAKLFVDFSFSMFTQVLLAQIIYIVVVILIATIIYRKGVKRLNVNGG